MAPPGPVEALLVGLGNPGPEHAGNRHNIGFMVVSELAARSGLRFSRARQGRLAVGPLAGRQVQLLQPLTFMNRSGRAVEAALAALADTGVELSADACLVIHDELDLPAGSLRLKRGGGHGGHRGLRSIIEIVGPGFARLRIGIGRPGPGADVSEYVLSDFPPHERAQLTEVLVRAEEAARLVLGAGLEAAMNEVNARNSE